MTATGGNSCSIGGNNDRRSYCKRENRVGRSYESSSESETESDANSSDTSSYFDSQDVVELEMFERKCKTLEVAYDKYNSMIRYMCSVMLSQLTTMQKVISLVAPSVELATNSVCLDDLVAAEKIGERNESDDKTATVSNES